MELGGSRYIVIYDVWYWPLGRNIKLNLKILVFHENSVVDIYGIFKILVLETSQWSDVGVVKLPHEGFLEPISLVLGLC